MQPEDQERRGTFRPPFDPQKNKYEKDRTDAENFTFSKKDVQFERNLKSAENPFKGIGVYLRQESLKPANRAETIMEVRSSIDDVTTVNAAKRLSGPPDP